MKSLLQFVERLRKPPRSQDADAVADPGKVIWVSPNAIRFKLAGPTIRRLRKESEVEPGDWDLDRRPIENTAKFRSIAQRFRDGMDWEQTDLFKLYEARLKRGGNPRGCRTIDELKEDYQANMDKVFVSLRENGFVLQNPGGRKPHGPTHAYIGRDGEIIFGSGGNHRLAMARLLNLDRVACRVLCRHADWQALRQELIKVDIESRRAGLGADLANHPDLDDLLTSDASVERGR